MYIRGRYGEQQFQRQLSSCRRLLQVGCVPQGTVTGLVSCLAAWRGSRAPTFRELKAAFCLLHYGFTTRTKITKLSRRTSSPASRSLPAHFPRAYSCSSAVASAAYVMCCTGGACFSHHVLPASSPSSSNTCSSAATLSSARCSHALARSTI